ncbi:CIR protein, partial [Plasmodium chabaudi adami]
MDKNVCKLFIDVDEVFNKGNVNEPIFNSSKLYKNFCPKGGCNTNYDRISALCEYLLTELQKLNKKPKGSKDNVNQSYEFVFMWLADKFLSIGRNRSLSLNDYYEKFIVSRGGNFNCWEKLDNKNDLKDGNLSVMSIFYQLFMNICNPIMKNEISNFELKKFMDFDRSSHQLYDLINLQVSNCDPYVQLLINLKKSYDEYRNLAIKNIPKEDLKNILTFLPIINNDDQKDLQFQSQGCKELHAMFEQSHKLRPKRRQRMSKPPSNDAKIQKGKVEINKGESNKPTNSAEKHNEPQKETQPSESKTLNAPQKTKEIVQMLPKSLQNLQEVSQNNNLDSSNATDISKDKGIVSETTSNRSKGDLSLPEPPPPQKQGVPLSPFPESATESIPEEPANIAGDSSDKLTDTGGESAKRIKRSISQDKLQNQKETTESPPTDSLSLENSESESSNIGRIIDYSINIFKTYSSLFNDTVNIIEDYIQDIVLSKFNEIIDKIIKYQKIIQNLGFTIGQIQIVNDHQNGSEKPQNEKVEQPALTQTTEETTGCLDGISSKLVGEPGNNVMGLSGNIAKLLPF